MYGSHCLKLSGVTMKNVDGQAMCAAHGAHLYHFKSAALDSQPLLDLLAAQEEMDMCAEKVYHTHTGDAAIPILTGLRR
nr:hypothetical protein BaRGS_021862 [Batillaria attramentaria]